MSDPTTEPADHRTIRLRCMTWAMRGSAPTPPLYLRTNAGRVYRVFDVRRARAGSRHRYTFVCTREREVPDGVRVYAWAGGVGHE